MLDVLWISPYALYDTVGHAGGKNQNFYLKNLHNKEGFNVYLISCVKTFEKKKLDLDDYSIDCSLCEISSKKHKQMMKKLMNIESTFNPFHRFAGVLQNYTGYILMREIKKYAKKISKMPDIIVLAWTDTVVLYPHIKKIFPNSKYVAVEEDVAFLGFERAMLFEKNIIKKFIARHRYKKIKKIELNALNNVDMVVNTNYKDKNLLIQKNIDEKKIQVWTPYFEDYSDVRYKRKNKDILFFGAMARPENYLSAIWFIEHVFNHIVDKECRFIVIGSNPSEKLLKYESDRIKIVGFVDDVREYFSNSLCLVAPLVLGAGVKIKVLEAFSAGIPVLTNDIGIEGISAIHGKEYFHCKRPGEYLEKINYLLENIEIGETLSKSSQEFVKNNYNLNESAEVFSQRLMKL